ncbi:cation:proton antiporter [Dyella tabacisoli]|uniref:Sodium:proton exchanger n=1 Tax=Dyella tabacisoli TaxID=2282381 RepID=A0A369UI30_9GAMM|nr:cation:proton antiporter [Dyella tabacisoli]RDD80412.1 sodium:proton exchanger [Dyella tabacisoli]
MTSTTLFLLQALVIILAPFILTYIFRLSMYLPPVVVQVLTGLALGPSLLGRVAPGTYEALFRPDALQPLQHVASMALLLFGFTSGMHLQWSSLRERGGALCTISLASLLVPGGLGLLTGIWVLRNYAAAPGPAASGLQFPAGIAICCAVTALPVLAAILRESRLTTTKIGQMALAIAAVNDAALWAMLGALLALSGMVHQPNTTSVTALLLLLPYWAALFTVFKLLIKFIEKHTPEKSQREHLQLTLACVLALGSAVLSEWGGLHYVLGAFVAGVAMPHSAREILLKRIEPLTVTVLMPFFFMSTGLKTLIDTSSPLFTGIFLAVTAAAVLGKLGGVAVAARLTGEPWCQAFALGALTQTKGLMEVVVVTILLDAGIFSRNVFSAVVLMAVLSTCLAMPITRLLLRYPARGASASALSALPSQPEPGRTPS